MSFVSVYVHFVWSTKFRLPLLSNRTIRMKVWRHIKALSKEKGIFIDHVNGYEDHCHCLISMKSTQTMEDIMRTIKGASSHWINETNLCNGAFEWQDDYYAVSVSPNVVDKVRSYIRNQEVHHKNKSFDAEMKEISGMMHFVPPPEGGGN